MNSWNEFIGENEFIEKSALNQLKLSTKQNSNQIASDNKSDRSDFNNKLNKLNQVIIEWLSLKSNSHEKAETTADIIDKSKAIYFGNLCNIQRVEVYERNVEICVWGRTPVGYNWRGEFLGVTAF